MQPHFLVHDRTDTVGVVVVEGIEAGQELEGWVMDNRRDDQAGRRRPRSRSATRWRSARSGRATRSSSTATTSVAPCRRSAPAGTSTSTTSRPRGGEHGRHRERLSDLHGLPGGRTAGSASATMLAILPVDDISNACVEGIAQNIAGTLPLPHSYGRLQFGADLELTFRTLIGTGRNPNVAACVVVGIEPGWTKRIVDAIAETGKPVEGFRDRVEGGDILTIAKASRHQPRSSSHWGARSSARNARSTSSTSPPKCGETTPPSGLGSNPTVGNLIDKVDAAGATTCFGETSETDRRGGRLRRARGDDGGQGQVPEHLERLQRLRSTENKTNDLSESQPHRRATSPAPDDDRGRRRSATCRRSASRPGSSTSSSRRMAADQGRRPLLHGYLLGGGGVQHPSGRVGRRGPPVPDRPGQTSSAIRSCR